MTHNIDPKKLKEVLKPMSTEERGRYMSIHVQEMIEDKCEEKWLLKDKPAKGAGSAYTEAFEAFWKAYPARQGSRSGKQPSFVAWKKQIKAIKIDEQTLLDQCLHALEWQKRSVQWREENGKYIPMPQTYLNQRRWEDERPEGEEAKKGYIDMNGIYHEPD